MNICVTWPWWVNTLRPGQNGRHFPDDIFKCIISPKSPEGMSVIFESDYVNIAGISKFKLDHVRIDSIPEWWQARAFLMSFCEKSHSHKNFQWIIEESGQLSLQTNLMHLLSTQVLRCIYCINHELGLGSFSKVVATFNHMGGSFNLFSLLH